VFLPMPKSIGQIKTNSINNFILKSINFLLEQFIRDLLRNPFVFNFLFEKIKMFCLSRNHIQGTMTNINFKPRSKWKNNGNTHFYSRYTIKVGSNGENHGRYPIPNRKDLVSHLSDALVFSKFDMKSGFWQIQICDQDRYKTAFTTPFGHYEWNFMPFDLKNAPSEFQIIMNSKTS
jgi:hypothetical protein